jgi:hypothetical protein
MHAKRIYVVSLVIGLLALMTGICPIGAQDTGDIPQITIEITAEGPALPEGMPEGAVHVTFANNSETQFDPLIIRLNDGVTYEALGAALEEGGEDAALSLVSLLGGLELTPGETNDAIFDFAPGAYLMVNDATEDQSLFPFTVVDGEGDGAAPPDADVEITLVDFAFDVPIAITTGPLVWHIQNAGDQPHHMFIVPLDDDMTPGEFNEFLLQILTGEESEGPEPIGGWSVMSPGEQVWIIYDLEPGTYALVCVLPDEEGSGHAHAELGMRQFINVTE